jgi:hypothetical protein
MCPPAVPQIGDEQKHFYIVCPPLRPRGCALVGGELQLVMSLLGVSLTGSKLGPLLM